MSMGRWTKATVPPNNQNILTTSTHNILAQLFGGIRNANVLSGSIALRAVMPIFLGLCPSFVLASDPLFVIEHAYDLNIRHSY